MRLSVRSWITSPALAACHHRTFANGSGTHGRTSGNDQADRAAPVGKGMAVPPVPLPQGYSSPSTLVMAPSDADETKAAYLAKTPEV